MSPWCFQSSFKSVGLLVQEKKWKIDFQDGRHCCHLGFPTGIILAFFDLQVILMLPTMLQVNWPFHSGEEAKNRFSRSWISDRNDFSYFWPTRHPDATYQVTKKKWKIHFQDGHHGGHLVFRIGMSLAIFCLHVTWILPTKFGVIWPFGSGEVKNRFSRWWLWQPSWISIRKDLTIFDLLVIPMLPTKFHVSWRFGLGEEANNRFSRQPPWRPSWISDQNDLAIFDLQVTPMLPTKFQVNWPFGSWEVKNRFSRWWPGSHLEFPVGRI